MSKKKTKLTTSDLIRQVTGQPVYRTTRLSQWMKKTVRLNWLSLANIQLSVGLAMKSSTIHLVQYVWRVLMLALLLGQS